MFLNDFHLTNVLYPLFAVLLKRDSPQVPSDWLITHGDSEVLKKKCPDMLENITEEDIVVWVDPLDGTSEYTQGFFLNIFDVFDCTVHASFVQICRKSLNIIVSIESNS